MTKLVLPGFWQVSLHPSEQHFKLPSHSASQVHSSPGTHGAPNRGNGNGGHRPGLAVQLKQIDNQVIVLQKL